MNAKILGLLIFAGFVVSSVVGWSNQSQAAPEPKPGQTSTVFAETDGLIAIQMQGVQGQIAVIDPKTRSLAIYQIDANGVSNLKSVRKIHWDLQLDDYNGSKPKVSDIRSTVENNLRR